MDYQYKIISAADLALFKELLKVFADAFEDNDAYQGAVPSDTYLTDFLNKQHVIVVIAADGHEVVGGIVAYVLEKFEQERKEIYIYDLAVSENHRRKGIASSMIKLLQTEAVKRGAYVIYVQADKGDEPAIKLYESLGTREDVHHFDIPVVE